MRSVLSYVIFLYSLVVRHDGSTVNLAPVSSSRWNSKRSNQEPTRPRARLTVSPVLSLRSARSPSTGTGEY
ncbi:hypothetical protein F4604DRAFT_1728006 [Suillus subluteus]|nr:hypothetical protein F4604DRAFT_1728006 [Suillus subluteus]